jgi:hypothetical protein
MMMMMMMMMHSGMINLIYLGYVVLHFSDGRPIQGPSSFSVETIMMIMVLLMINIMKGVVVIIIKK